MDGESSPLIRWVSMADRGGSAMRVAWAQGGIPEREATLVQLFLHTLCLHCWPIRLQRVTGWGQHESPAQGAETLLNACGYLMACLSYVTPVSFMKQNGQKVWLHFPVSQLPDQKCLFQFRLLSHPSGRQFRRLESFILLLAFWEHIYFSFVLG